jgi:hypothetical protein
MKTLNPSDLVAVVDAIDPDAYAADDYVTAWIDMGTFQSLMGVVLAGALGSSATIDAKFEQAKDAAGTGVKDVADSDITQLTQAGTDDSDKQAVIELHAADLDLANEFTHARLSVTVGTATSDMGAVLLGLNPQYMPASDNDATSVAEIVTV